MLTIALQHATSTQLPWHRQGMFFGTHWAWWLIWIATVVVLLWAFWRLLADRREAHRDATRRLSAEDVLRHRFAKGEISEEEYVARLRLLGETSSVDDTPL